MAPATLVKQKTPFETQAWELGFAHTNQAFMSFHWNLQVCMKTNTLSSISWANRTLLKVHLPAS